MAFFHAIKVNTGAIYGAYEAIVECGAITILGLVGVFFLYLLYSISFGIRTGTFWDMVGELILGFILLAFIIGLVGGLGAVILEIVVMIVSFIIGVSITILEFLNSWAETAYVFFLKKIKQKVDLL